MREGRRVTTILATLLLTAACGGGSTTAAKPSPTPLPTPMLSSGVSGSDTITTIAGTGKAGISGDGGPATSAAMHAPSGVAVDGQGNVYVADYGNNRVRKVSPGGTITTIAGTGIAGFSGDGGPAALAQLYTPVGVAVDGQANVFIADDRNNRVRKVSPGGTITTIAGTGTRGVSGDGGAAASAQLNHPAAVAVDGQGNVYIADTENSRVRKVSAGMITTIAGTGKAGIFGFSGDGGPATTAQLSYPEAVAVDMRGSVYIGDSYNHRVRMVSGGTITTIAGTGIAGFSGDGGPASSASLSYPAGAAVDGQGNVYVTTGSRVRKMSGGTITTIAGTGIAGFSGDGGPAAMAQLGGAAPGYAWGVAVDTQGNLYIADYSNSRVRKVGASA